jgi:hypothetical protein
MVQQKDSVMEISANGAVMMAMAMQQANTHQQIQISMFKKNLDIGTQNAMTLIQSVPTPPSNQGLPANLGNHINVTA